MTEKRFTTDTPNSLSEIYDDGRILTNGEVIKYINWYREDMRKFSVENEQLKQSISHYADITACSVEVMNEDDELKNDYASILCTKMEKVVKENEQLKQTIEEFRAYDKRDYIESEHINNIYKEFGFDGVIEEVKSRLVYGTVTEMDNLIRISTGGWSDDEALLDVLISPMTRFHYHYVGYLVGGAFYFDKDKSFESFRKIRLIKDLEKGDVND